MSDVRAKFMTDLPDPVIRLRDRFDEVRRSGFVDALLRR
jgi:hypothetical protein